MKVASSVQESTSHSFAVSSSLAVASWVPSGLNATPNTQSVWPVKVTSSAPESTTESPWDVWRLSVLDMKESNEFTQGFESAALHAC